MTARRKIEHASAPPKNAANVRPAKRQRLDLALVDRGIAPSREKARAYILAGDVQVDGRTEARAGALVPADAVITLAQPARFVSRGGEKLDHALAHFAIDVRGRVAADVGASTGGFTDCLLQRGAARVYAIDVGYGQLDLRLRDDPRVVVMERTNARDLASLPQQPDLATVDASFISLTKLLPAVVRVLRPGADIIALVKPQFEAEKHEVKRGGVVRDPLVHAAVIGRVAWWCVNHGLRVRGVAMSPLLGPAGNREFFLWLETPAREAP
ncbi:MAG TPA: TlyA family RNA methyltransferase [Dehalococcoidia bacterium]|nr:TlyA family RNA methyltransferase [Dehalococcoidia bacterium]